MILHLDMDAFFASVEQMDNPDLRGKPVIVGGRERGVVATASYEARAYGIHSAMPIVTARKLCPGGIFVRGQYKRYSEISRMVMRSLGEFSPVIQKASIDEAYLDVSRLAQSGREPIDIAIAVKDAVARSSGGLTCSIGMAPIKFLAKICSDLNKPDGIFILHQEDMDAFLLDLPVGAIPGVGKAMKSSLHSFGIFTVAQLRNLSKAFLIDRYGKFGADLHDRAHGIDPRGVHENNPARSESCEHTFAMDIFDRATLKRKLREQAERVGASLARNGFAGRTITLKLKFSDFRQITRSCTIEARTSAPAVIFSVASKLLDAVALQKSVRLIGVCVSGFEPRLEQHFLPGFDSLAARAF